MVLQYESLPSSRFNHHSIKLPSTKLKSVPSKVWCASSYNSEMCYAVLCSFKWGRKSRSQIYGWLDLRKWRITRLGRILAFNVKLHKTNPHLTNIVVSVFSWMCHVMVIFQFSKTRLWCVSAHYYQRGIWKSFGAILDEPSNRNRKIQGRKKNVQIDQFLMLVSNSDKLNSNQSSQIKNMMSTKCQVLNGIFAPDPLKCPHMYLISSYFLII